MSIQPGVTSLPSASISRRPGPTSPANLRNPLPVNRQVADKLSRPRPVNNPSVPNHDVVHLGVLR